ncbi:MAG: zinc ribbon domain-containing protein [Calditrichaeota bacterium]|nr:zinc ribbon domain-containing protein [Calditrichota bacterium]
MPTYDYHCLSCGHLFEAFHGIQDEPIRACPKCGGRIERLISGGTGLIFKGSGFYITDYPRKKETSTPDLKKDKEKSDSETKTKKTPTDD